MKTFLVLYMAPVKVLDDWAKTDPATRKPAEEKMMGDWNRWMADHASAIKETRSAGKTKRVQADGIADFRNEIMLYSIVEADSHDEAAQIFASHPHLGIPQASIEITEVRSMTGA